VSKDSLGYLARRVVKVHKGYKDGRVSRERLGTEVRQAKQVLRAREARRAYGASAVSLAHQVHLARLVRGVRLVSRERKVQRANEAQQARLVPLAFLGRRVPPALPAPRGSRRS
jgi:hypothetical protein